MEENGDSNEQKGLSDRLIEEGLKPASRALADSGVHVSTWTVIRWIRRGVRGRRLEGVKIGGRWYSTDQAVKRFLNQKVSPDGEESNPKKTSSAKASEKFLQNVGLGKGGC